MKQLNKKQRDMVCEAINDSLLKIKDDEESIYYNLGYYGEQIRCLLRLMQDGYDEYYGFEHQLEILTK